MSHRVREDLSTQPSGLWEKAVGKMAERDGRGEKIEESQNPAFIGQGAVKPEMDRGRGVSEPVASSAAPDDGAACDQLGPITAAALLLCHPALDAGSR